MGCSRSGRSTRSRTSTGSIYDRHVRPWIEEADSRRAFVIISDAFRYEAAQELTAELNGKYRFGAVLSSQLGVLPSYTALGMASLLPHKSLSYKGADVLVDGHASAAGERDGMRAARSHASGPTGRRCGRSRKARPPTTSTHS
jgi:PglZ domain